MSGRCRPQRNFFFPSISLLSDIERCSLAMPDGPLRIFLALWGCEGCERRERRWKIRKRGTVLRRSSPRHHRGPHDTDIEPPQGCCGASGGNKSLRVQCSRRQTCSSRSKPTFCSPISIRWSEDFEIPSCRAKSRCVLSPLRCRISRANLCRSCPIHGTYRV